MALLDIVASGLGLISLAGWVGGLGLLLFHILGGPKPSWSEIVAAGCAGAISILVLFSPWIPFVAPFPEIAGLALVFIIWKWRIQIPRISIPRGSPWTVTATLVLGGIYTYAFLAYPDISFDMISYHHVFISEFARVGTIPFSPTLVNWVDWVHVAFPKGADLLMGVAHQLVPGSESLLELVILGACVVLLNRIGTLVGLRDAWAAGALWLASIGMIFFLRIFPSELLLFLFIESVFVLALDPSLVSRFPKKWVYFFFVGWAMASIKTNAIVLAALLGVLLVAWNHRREGVFLGLGALAGAFFSYIPAMVSGYDVLDAFAHVQALTLVPAIPILERFRSIVMGISVYMFRFLPANTLGLGLLTSGILILVDKPARRVYQGVGLLFVGFALAFAGSSLFYTTYREFGRYMLAFAGFFPLFLARFFQRIGDLFPRSRGRMIPGVVMMLILIAGLTANLLILISVPNYTALNSGYYPRLLEIIPNDPGTHVLFMNNINPITQGLERATVWDYTTFPRMEGDPCTFWRAHGITHVAYLNQGLPTTQLDGGNPTFYEDARTELLASTCTTLAYNGGSPVGPLIGIVTPQ